MSRLISLKGVFVVGLYSNIMRLLLIGIYIMIYLVFLITLTFANSATIRASFSVRADAVINLVSIKRMGDTKPVTSLTPNMEYDVWVEVEDLDGIGNESGGVAKLEVKLWYDPTGMKGYKDYFEKQNMFNPRNSISITWDKVLNVATIDDGTVNGKHEWELITSVLPTNKQLQDEKYTRHMFVFTIKIGENAKCTLDSFDACWQIGAKVKEQNGSYTYGYLECFGIQGVHMQRYVTCKSDKTAEMKKHVVFNDDVTVNNTEYTSDEKILESHGQRIKTPEIWRFKRVLEAVSEHLERWSKLSSIMLFIIGVVFFFL